MTFETGGDLKYAAGVAASAQKGRSVQVVLAVQNQAGDRFPPICSVERGKRGKGARPIGDLVHGAVVAQSACRCRAIQIAAAIHHKGAHRVITVEAVERGEGGDAV